MIQLIRIQLRVPEYGWTTQKVFYLINFIVNGGFTSTRRLLSSDATAGASPLTPTLADRYGKAEAEKAVSKPSKVQAILKNIKQLLHYAINSVIYRLSVPM
ncbi:hypothetical protein HanXRQr2_Chr08g0320021 [Helianthus annuus]|uniref:THH1/TOM1/TOM3 domain-containing protein n=1 Tax=Helianthus annuus TaxID=4232 RepID=A0A251U317_HELAN|nr:hypothetical protein HanXRQr2_Chr08g0320021 [Helianthus annuus]